MSGFYITLPSNSSIDYFPDNTQSSFRTNLSQNITFNSPHEVALVEMNYAPYFLTELGDVIIKGYFKETYEIFNPNIAIPINIYQTTELLEFLTFLNNSIKKAIIFEDNLYRFRSVFVKTSTILLDLHYNKNKEKLSNNNFSLEVFKKFDDESNYIVLDKEESVFRSDFLAVKNSLGYNKKMMKWEFTNKQLIELNQKFKLNIYLTKIDLINVINSVNVEKHLDDFIYLEHLDYVEQTDLSLDSKFDILKDLEIDELSTNTKLFDNVQIEIKKTSIFKNMIIFPEFKVERKIDSHKSIVKFELSKVEDVILLTNKLANIFLENDRGFIKNNSLIVLENLIHANNYAMIYTDIIKNQVFGDVNSNVLKIIPIKSSSESEVVTFFDNLHYVPLSKNSFNTINIEIRDLYGNKIKFEDKFTFVIIKLHFRKIKNE